MKKEPLILTLLLDEEAHNYFTSLRNLYFPKYCNYLEAHLTLFHKLPADKKIITDTLKEMTNKAPMSLQVTGLKSMGTGVAFVIESAALMKLRKTLQEKFSRYLITQDRQKLWPHITVQNKVTAFKASQTLSLLQKDFKPFTIQGLGIESWLYKDGPWEKVEEYRFSLTS